MTSRHHLLSCGLLLVLLGWTLPQAGADEEKPRPRPDDALRRELLRMVKEDQDVRKEAIRGSAVDPPAARKLADADRKNTARMKEVIEKHGWPGRSLVGEDGAHAAWLLVQHADRDHKFQKRCLKLLEQAARAGEATGTELAYLTDRVLVAEGKQQIYGTQFRFRDGKLEPSPIQDEANVDRRRKAVGLPTMGEYRKTLEEVYKPRREAKEPAPIGVLPSPDRK